MIVNQLKGKFIDWDNVTSKTVALRIMQVMRNHVGVKNAVDKVPLFEATYGIEIENVSDLNYDLLSRYLSAAMTYLRQHSNLFIVTTFEDGNRKYFVPKTEEEAKEYHNYANKRIRGFNKLKRRVNISVKEKWFAQEWEFDSDDKEKDD